MPIPFTFREALIVQHCAVIGRLEQLVRAYHIGEVERYAQYPVSVRVAFLAPRKRRAASFRVVPDNIRYLTVEGDGHVIYDSRADVPCDMTAWNATDQKFRERGRLARERYVPQAGVTTTFPRQPC
jgi:hypothetical protein